ncbi:oxidoreductase [Streptomyces sp. NPDC004227]
MAGRGADCGGLAAGFELVELHGAHGYLLHSFLSPLANHRTDAYGGSLANRMRFPLRVVAAVRAAVGPKIALAYRLSAVDGVVGGLGRQCPAEPSPMLGVDLLDVSSGGITAGREPLPGFRDGFAFHAPYSREIRKRCGMPVVGVVALGRELLADPDWPGRAVVALGGDHCDWHPPAGHYLHLREPEPAELAVRGETPMIRYLNDGQPMIE